MEIKNIPFQVTDWSKIEPAKYNGETGFALWKTLDFGCVRVRMI